MVKRNYLKEFVNAVLAGGLIAIGGLLNLKLGGVIGALFFTIGLFVILSRKCSLFTGKLCSITDTGPIELLVVWIGNLVGAVIVAAMIQLTKLSVLSETAATFILSKENLLSVFVLGIFCEFMINIAVYPFKKPMSDLLKLASLFLAIPGFILLGFEHSIANMFYCAMAMFKEWHWEYIWVILVSTAGNLVGAAALYGIGIARGDNKE